MEGIRISHQDYHFEWWPKILVTDKNLNAVSNDSWRCLVNRKLFWGMNTGDCRHDYGRWWALKFIRRYFFQIATKMNHFLWIFRNDFFNFSEALSRQSWTIQYNGKNGVQYNFSRQLVYTIRKWINFYEFFEIIFSIFRKLYLDKTKQTKILIKLNNENRTAW